MTKKIIITDPIAPPQGGLSDYGARASKAATVAPKPTPAPVAATPTPKAPSDLFPKTDQSIISGLPYTELRASDKTQSYLSADKYLSNKESFFGKIAKAFIPGSGFLGAATSAAKDFIQSKLPEKPQKELTPADIIRLSEGDKQNYFRQQRMQESFKKEGVTKELQNDPYGQVKPDYVEPQGFGGTLVESLKRGWASTAKPAVGYFVESMANVVPLSPEAQANLRNWGEKFGDKMTAKFIKQPELLRDPTIKDFVDGGAKDPRWYAATIGETLPTVATTLATTTAGALIGSLGGPGGAAVGARVGAFSGSMALETSTSYKDMIDRGIDPRKAADASKLYGVIAATLENVIGFKPAEVVMGGGKNVILGSFKDFVRTTLPTYSANFLKKTVAEGGEEAAQQLAQNLVTKWLDNSQQVWSGVAESFFAGMAGSLGLGGSEIVGDIYRANYGKGAKETQQKITDFHADIADALATNSKDEVISQVSNRFNISQTDSKDLVEAIDSIRQDNNTRSQDAEAQAVIEDAFKTITGQSKTVSEQISAIVKSPVSQGEDQTTAKDTLIKTVQKESLKAESRVSAQQAPELSIPLPEKVQEQANTDWAQNYSEEYANLSEKAIELQDAINSSTPGSETQKTHIQEYAKVAERMLSIEEGFTAKYQTPEAMAAFIPGSPEASRISVAPIAVTPVSAKEINAAKRAVVEGKKAGLPELNRKLAQEGKIAIVKETARGEELSVIDIQKPELTTDKKLIGKLEVDLLNAYKEHPAFETEITNLLEELGMAEAGSREAIPNAKRGEGSNMQFFAIPSTFPSWIPDNARTRKDLNRLMELVSMDSITFPTHPRATKMRAFVDTFLSVLDQQLGIDTKDIRSDILNQYGETTYEQNFQLQDEEALNIENDPTQNGDVGNTSRGAADSARRQAIKKYEEAVSESQINEQRARLQYINETLVRGFDDFEGTRLTAEDVKSLEAERDILLPKIAQLENPTGIDRIIDDTGKEISEMMRFQVMTQTAASNARFSNDEALGIIRSYFSESEVPVQFVNNIFTPSGMQAWGKYGAGMITFVNNPMESTPHHEAVHAFMDLFIDQKNRRTILDTIKRDQKKKMGDHYAPLSDYDAEEILADGFVSYVQNRKGQSVLKAFYDRIIRFLKSFVKDTTVEKFYNDIINRKRSVEKNIINKEFSAFNAIEDRFAYTTKTLNRIVSEIKKDTVSKKLIDQYTRRDGVTKYDAIIVNETLAEMEGEEFSKDDFVAKARAKIMPLALLRTTKYADYGIRSLEQKLVENNADPMHFGFTETHLYDSPFKHGVTGHWGEEYGSVNFEYDIQHVAGVQDGVAVDTFIVKQKGVTLNEDNIAEAVRGTFASLQEAEEYIAKVKETKPKQSGLAVHVRIAEEKNAESDKRREIRSTKMDLNENKRKLADLESIKKQAVLFIDEYKNTFSANSNAIVTSGLSNTSESSLKRAKEGEAVPLNYLGPNMQYQLGSDVESFYRAKGDMPLSVETKISVYYDGRIEVSSELEGQIVRYKGMIASHEEAITKMEAKDVGPIAERIRYLTEIQSDPMQERYRVSTLEKEVDDVRKAFVNFVDGKNMSVDLISSMMRSPRIVIPGINKIISDYQMQGSISPEQRQHVLDSLDKIVADYQKTSEETQFFGVMSHVHERALKEEVRLAAHELLVDGTQKATLRVPTAFTVSSLEGHVSGYTPVNGVLKTGGMMNQEMSGGIQASYTKEVFDSVFPDGLKESDNIIIFGKPFVVENLIENNGTVSFDLSEGDSWVVQPYEWDDREGEPEFGSKITLGVTDYIVINKNNNDLKLAPSDRARRYDVQEAVDDNVSQKIGDVISQLEDIEATHGAIVGSENASKIIGLIEAGKISTDNDFEVKLALQIMVDRGEDDITINDDPVRDGLGSEFNDSEWDFANSDLAGYLGLAEAYVDHNNPYGNKAYGVEEGGDTVDALVPDAYEEHPKYFFASDSKLKLPKKEEQAAATPVVHEGEYLFNPDSIKDNEYRTVHNYYRQKVVPYFKKLRKDAKLVVDQNGYQWWETELTAQDKQAVEAYQVKDSVPQESLDGSQQQAQDSFIDSTIAVDDSYQEHFQTVAQASGLFKLAEETRLEKLRRKMQDQNARIEVMQDQLKAQGAIIPESSDVFLMKTLMPRRIGGLTSMFQEKVVHPFIEQMTLDGISVEELDKYLLAKHAPERNAAMVEKGYDGGTGSGMSDEDSVTVLQEFSDSGKTQKLETLRLRIQKILDLALDLEVSQGLVSQEDAAVIRSKYQYYVPLQRVMDDDSGGIGGTGKGVDIRGKESKRAKGSERQVLPILAQVFNRYEKAIVRSEKNKVGLALLDLIENNKDRISSLFKVESQKYVPVYDESGEVQYMSPLFQTAQNVIGVKKDGKQYFITVKDPLIVRALKEAGRTYSIPYLRAFIAFKSAMTTRYAPEFWVTNFERDIAEAMINLGQVKDTQLSKEQGKNLKTKILKDVGSMVRAVYRDNRGKETQYAELIKEFKVNGGQTGYFYLDTAQKRMESLDALQKQLAGEGIEKVKNVGRAALQLVDDINESIELGVRLSTYKNLVESGVSKKRASEVASNLTIDFNKQGEWGGVLKSLYLFINPAIQSSYRSIKAGTVSKKVLASIASMTVLGFVTAMMSSMWGGDDNDDDIPDYQKNTKIILATPFTESVTAKDGTVSEVPKTITLWSLPYGYGAFYALGRRLYEVSNGRLSFLDFTTKSFSAFADSYNPFGGSDISAIGLLPDVAQMPVEISANKSSFFGGPIHPDQPAFEAKKPSSQLAWKSTSNTSKDLAGFMNKLTGGDDVVSGWMDISPATLDYMTTQLTGSLGRFVKNTFDSGYSVATGEDIKSDNIPFVRLCTGTVKTEQIRSAKVYDMADESGRTIFSPERQQEFYDTVDLLQQRGYFPADRAEKLKDDFKKNQYKTENKIDLKTGTLRSAYDSIQSGTSFQDAVKTAATELYGEDYGKDNQTKVQKAIQTYQTFGTDNELVNNILNAGTTVERVALLKKAREEMDPQDFADFYKKATGNVTTAAGRSTNLLLSDAVVKAFKEAIQ